MRKDRKDRKASEASKQSPSGSVPAFSAYLPLADPYLTLVDPYLTLAGLDPTRRLWFGQPELAPGPALPVIQRADPIVTWKQAQLVKVGRTVELKSRIGGLHHDADAEAICTAGYSAWLGTGRPVDYRPPTHKVPTEGCTCGFYAYDKRPHTDDRYVILEVELSGRVIEHETGYRAQYQRILGVHVPGGCSSVLCPNPAAWLVFDRNDEPGEPVCEQHHDPAYPMNEVTLAQVSNALGVECTWDTKNATGSGDQSLSRA